jgi:alpha-beta hydrolase superfamily lysophospholipase
MIETEAILKCTDVTLFYRFVVPKNPRAILIIVHGVSEHGGRYLRLQRELSELGFAVFAYDQRGFGKSTGRRTYAAHYTDFLNDLKEIIDTAKKEIPGQPIILIGHSFGGLVVSAFCIHFPEAVKRIILSAPAYMFIPLPAILHFMGIALNRFFPTIRIRYPSDPSKLSHDKDIVNAFRADPLAQTHGTPRFYHALKEMNDMVRRRTDQISLPTLILQGTEDTIVYPQGAQTLYDKISSKKKRLIFYEGFYHEPFNEVGRGKVVTDVVGWLNDL